MKEALQNEGSRKETAYLLACFMILGMLFVIMKTTGSAVAESYQWTDTGGGMSSYSILSLVRGGSCLYALTNGNGSVSGRHLSVWNCSGRRAAV